MKNTWRYIIALAAVAASALSSGPLTFAQLGGGVGYSKSVSGPNENGVYTIDLEAYVTGKVTVETSTAPADIVLVLDYSSSMQQNMAGDSQNVQNQNRRINILRSAVQSFVETVKTSNNGIQDKDKDDIDADGEKDGHRIAIILYSGNVYVPGERPGYNAGYNGYRVPTDLSLNTFLNVEYLSTTAASGSNNNYVPATVKYSGDTNANGLLSPDTTTGTFSGSAMTRANTLLSQQNYSSDSKRSRVVVFFTDGEPGYGTTSWTGTGLRRQQAVECINSANTIKNSSTYSGTVYAVGLFNAQTTANWVTTYMAYTSSDYNDGTLPTTNAGPFVNTGDHSIIVSSAGELANVFSSIASSASDTFSAASSSSVLVDIVASNFKIPAGTDLGSVKVYQVPCTQASATAIISFSTNRNQWTDITSQVTLETNKETGEVSVTGFDYGTNWCGWDASANNNQGAAHGSEIRLEIPIIMQDEAIGGPSVETNAEGSQLVIRDNDPDTADLTFPFISPTVKIPVSIWIKKKGMNGDDSAIFTIRRFYYYQRNEDGTDVIEDDHRVPVEIEDFSTIPNKKPSEDYTGPVWESFTKLSVNKKYNAVEGEPDACMVKISGLDPDYVYKIEEDAWAHLGYDFDPNATARFTIEVEQVTEGGETHYVHKEIMNPFIFTNTPKGTVYAEDVIQNKFGQGSGTGQGLTTTGSGSGTGSE